MLASELESKLVVYLDTHAKIARGATWVVTGLNAVNAVGATLQGNIIGGALSAVTAVALVWMLVKTRATVF